MSQRIFDAFRRNTMDKGQKEVLIGVLTEDLKLPRKEAIKLAEAFQSVLKANNVKVLTQANFDLYSPVLFELAAELKQVQRVGGQAQVSEVEGPAPIFEPAVSFPKPFLLDEGFDTRPDAALVALRSLVEMLAQEGPVKGGGTRKNPYRKGTQLRRGYRTNPYLPDDQDPLSIYLARLRRPGKIGMTMLEHLRAARLLLAHTKEGKQNPPDFDSAQISRLVKFLETRAAQEGWTVPTGPLKPDDYRIINPQAGSIRWMTVGGVAGLLSWRWDGGDSFDLSFPWYDQDPPKDAAKNFNHFLFAPLDNTKATREDLINVEEFVQSLEDVGYRAEVRESSRGQFATLGLRAETNAGKVIALSIIQAGKATNNASVKEYGTRLGLAWRMWSFAQGQGTDSAGLPSGSTTKTTALTPAMVESVASYYSELQAKTYTAKKADVIDSLRGVAYDRRRLKEYVAGAARVLEAIQGASTSIIGLPVTSEKFATKYEVEARPEDQVIWLPADCIPFRIQRAEQSPAYDIWIGVDAFASSRNAVDRVDFVNAFWQRAKISGNLLFPGLLTQNQANPAGVVSVQSQWDLKSTQPGHGQYNEKSTRCYRIALSQLEKFVVGLESILDPENGDYPVIEHLFAVKFVEQYTPTWKTAYPPKVLTDVGGIFLPLAVAIRKGVLLQGLPTTRTDGLDQIDGKSLALALSEFSPTPEGGLVGAGRIDPATATSLVTGRSVEAPGLPANIKASVASLLPPKTFRHAFQETVGGKTYESKQVNRIFYPYPFQDVGIAFIHAANCRAMIGDEMGLGKTIQALGALTLDPSPTTGQSMLPALIICPASVKGSWQVEVERWLPHLSVGQVGNSAEAYDVSIMSWGMVSRHYAAHVGRYMTVIVDEAHYGKRLYKVAKASNRPTLKQLMENNIRIKGKPSPFTARTYGFVRIAQGAPHAILLSGTFMENGSRDIQYMWTYLHALDPVRFPDSKQFYATYINPAVGKKGPDLQQALLPFRQVVNEYHIRRMKSTVAEQIQIGCLYAPEYGASDSGCAGSEPEVVEVEIQANGRSKRRPYRQNSRRNTRTRRNQDGGFMRVGVTKKIQKVFVKLNDLQQAEYEEMKGPGLILEIKRAKIAHAIKAIIALIYRGGSVDLSKLAEAVLVSNEDLLSQDASKIAGVVLAAMNYERNMVGKLKLPQASRLISESLAAREPLIVWVDRRETGDAIIAALSAGIRYATIRGGTPAEERTKIVKDFQEGKLEVIVASQAMREGVTLTRANRAIFVEMWWVGAWLSQAEDRIYRIGQKRDCTISYLLVPNSIDTRMWDAAEVKRKLTSMVFGDDKFSLTSEDDDEMDVGIGYDPDLTPEQRVQRAEENRVAMQAFMQGEDDENKDDDDKGDSDIERATAALIQETMETTIQNIEKSMRDRMEAEEMQVSEQMVLDALMEMGIKETRYSLTNAGAKWVESFVLRMERERAITLLDNMRGLKASPRRSMDINLFVNVAKRNEKTREEHLQATAADLRAVEGGLEALKTFRELTAQSDASLSSKVARVVQAQHTPKLPPDEATALEELQVLAPRMKDGQVDARQFLPVVKQALVAEGRGGGFNLTKLQKLMDALIGHKLVKVHETALGDIRGNPTRPGRARKSAPAFVLPPIPPQLAAHLRRNEGKHHARAAYHAADTMGASLIAQDYDAALVAYNELNDHVGALQERGDTVPPRLSRALHEAHQRLTRAYRG